MPVKGEFIESYMKEATGEVPDKKPKKQPKKKLSEGDAFSDHDAALKIEMRSVDGPFNKFVRLMEHEDDDRTTENN